MATAAGFLQKVLHQYPFRLNKLLTDNGIEFSYNLLVEAMNKKIKTNTVKRFHYDDKAASEYVRFEL